MSPLKKKKKIMIIIDGGKGEFGNFDAVAVVPGDHNIIFPEEFTGNSLGLPPRAASHYWLIRFIFQNFRCCVLRDLFAYGVYER